MTNNIYHTLHLFKKKFYNQLSEFDILYGIIQQNYLKNIFALFEN